MCQSLICYQYLWFLRECGVNGLEFMVNNETSSKYQVFIDMITNINECTSIQYLQYNAIDIMAFKLFLRDFIFLNQNSRWLIPIMIKV